MRWRKKRSFYFIQYPEEETGAAFLVCPVQQLAHLVFIVYLLNSHLTRFNSFKSRQFLSDVPASALRKTTNFIVFSLFYVVQAH